MTNIKYSDDGTVLINCPTDMEGQVSVKPGTLGIMQNAFKGCGKVTDIILPDAIKKIGSNAFNGCRSLLTVEMPDSLEYIGKAAFKDCYALKGIVIPGGVVELQPQTFDCCIMMTDVVLQDGLKVIGNNCFRNCWHIENITIPATVQNIGCAFNNCFVLNKFVIQSTYANVSSFAFLGCEQLKKVWKPFEPIVDNNPGEKPFSLCRKIKPNQFRGIALIRMVIPGRIKKVPEGAFADCRLLKELLLEDGVEEIGEVAFANCTSLIEMQFPKSVKTIGKRAFAGCSNLRTVYVPESTSIADDAFDGCNVNIQRTDDNLNLQSFATQGKY